MKYFKFGTFFGAQGVFALAFFYSLSVGLLVQLVLLPAVMPELDAGHGLLKGGDWVWFQQQAVLLADRIHHEGWVIWELGPRRNSPIGVAAAAYALTGTREPWVLMPLNAGLYAVGAACLYLMFTCIASRRLAFVAILPYLLFPSAVMIYGQIHKDAWSIAGLLLINLAWVRFAVSNNLAWRNFMSQVALVLAGAWLVWVVRPYLLKILLAASTLTVLILAIRAIVMHRDLRKRHTGRWWIGIVLCLSILGMFAELSPGGAVPGGAVPGETDLALTERLVKSMMAHSKNLVSAVAKTRNGFASSSHAGSNIDTGVQFHSATDVLRYVPRALQIGLFAPFPEMWSETGVSPGADWMRLLAGIEMGFAYFLLSGFVLAFMRRGLHGSSAVILIQAAVPILVLALVGCNN